MALKIELKGTSPGCADLSISGGGSDPGPIEISIQRNQDEHFLALGGGWQATPYWHVISDVDATTDGMVASVGAEIVDPVVESTGMMFLVGVRSGGVNGQQVPAGCRRGAGTRPGTRATARGTGGRRRFENADVGGIGAAVVGTRCGRGLVLRSFR